MHHLPTYIKKHNLSHIAHYDFPTILRMSSNYLPTQSSLCCGQPVFEVGGEIYCSTYSRIFLSILKGNKTPHCKFIEYSFNFRQLVK